MATNFNISLLPDLKFNKNLSVKRIVLAPKSEKKLLKMSDIQKIYDNMINSGKYNSRDVCIRVEDATGKTITVKGNRQDNIVFDENYAEDKVANPDKFEVATKCAFFINTT